MGELVPFPKPRPPGADMPDGHVPCARCRAPLAEAATVCPSCGARYSGGVAGDGGVARTGALRRWAPWVAVGLVAAWVLSRVVVVVLALLS